MLKKLTSMALWKQILICIVLGAIVGIWAPGVVPRIKFLGDIFLRLLKMLIAPLVLFTLISGVCKMGDIKHLYTVGNIRIFPCRAKFLCSTRFYIPNTKTKFWENKYPIRQK